MIGPSSPLVRDTWMDRPQSDDPLPPDLAQAQREDRKRIADFKRQMAKAPIPNDAADTPP